MKIKFRLYQVRIDRFHCPAGKLERAFFEGRIAADWLRMVLASVFFLLLSEAFTGGNGCFNGRKLLF